MSTAEIAGEQAYVSMLYGQLDPLRDRTTGRLAEVLAAPGGTDQARSERDAFAADLSRRIAQIDAAEHGLCFGRLDRPTATRRYIGRIGIVRRRRRLRAAAGRLAGARGPAVLPRHRRLARTGCAAAGTSAPGCAQVVGSTTRCSTWPRAATRDPARRADRRGRAARRAERRPHRPDARHRRDHPGRAGPDHPRRPRRRAGRPGRPRHRQDRGRAAPRGLPALHPPRAAGHAAAC